MRARKRALKHRTLSQSVVPTLSFRRLRSPRIGITSDLPPPVVATHGNTSKGRLERERFSPHAVEKWIRDCDLCTDAFDRVICCSMKNVLLVAALAFGSLGYCSLVIRNGVRMEQAGQAYGQGNILFEEGRYAEAAARYREWKEYQDSVGEDSSEITGLVGHALDLAGRTEEAEKLLEESLASQPQARVYLLKAHFLARHESEAAALAWLEGAPLTTATKAPLTARFLRELGRHDEALPILEDLLQQTAGSRYLVHGELRAPDEVDAEVHRQMCDLLDRLSDLAESHLRAGNLDAAERYANLGVSAGQITKRDAKSWSPRYAEAGDFRCRVVRAHVRMRRGELDPAAEEIEHAKQFPLNYPTRERELQAVVEDLRRLRLR